MFGMSFELPCKGCGFNFEPKSYPPKSEEDKYCNSCKPVVVSNDIMKGWS